MNEDADQRKDGRVRRRFIPMIEVRFERPLASNDRNDRAEDDCHPHQRGEASRKTNAAKCRKGRQDDHSDAKPNEHATGRELRNMSRLSHESNLDDERPRARRSLRKKAECSLHPSRELRQEHLVYQMAP